MKIFDDKTSNEEITPEVSSIFESEADQELDLEGKEQDPTIQGEESTEEPEAEEENSKDEDSDEEESEEDESDEAEEEPEDNTDSKKTVPYERFAEVNRKKKEAEEKLAQELAKAAESKKDPKDLDELELPEEYVNLMGDDEDARKFFALFQRMTKEGQAEAIEQVKQAQQEEAQREEEELNRIVEEMEGSLEEIEAEHGIKLTGTSKEAEANRDSFLKYVETLSYGEDIYPLDRAFPLWNQQRTPQKPGNKANKEVARRIAGKTTGANDTDSQPRELDWHTIGNN